VPYFQLGAPVGSLTNEPACQFVEGIGINLYVRGTSELTFNTHFFSRSSKRDGERSSIGTSSAPCALPRPGLAHESDIANRLTTRMCSHTGEYFLFAHHEFLNPTRRRYTHKEHTIALKFLGQGDLGDFVSD
jgi:hypothetical protein